jgi:chromosome partitioning protein
MRAIAFMSEKGGSGKTTSVLNVGACLVQLGHRVLIADADPQANASLVLLHGEKARRPTIHEVLTAQSDVTEAIVSTTTDGLDVLPAESGLAEANLSLVNELGRERRLRRALEALPGSYGFVLVDTSPQRTLINVNVLNAVDEVIVPISPGLFSLAGLGQLQSAVDEVRQFLDNRTLRIAGLVLTMMERNNVGRDIEEQIRGTFGPLVFNATIPRSVKLEESHSRFLSVVEYAPRSPGARAYQSLTEEILAHGQHGEAERTRGGTGGAAEAHDAA